MTPEFFRASTKEKTIEIAKKIIDNDESTPEDIDHLLSIVNATQKLSREEFLDLISYALQKGKMPEDPDNFPDKELVDDSRRAKLHLDSTGDISKLVSEITVDIYKKVDSFLIKEKGLRYGGDHDHLKNIIKSLLIKKIKSI
jgi:hypothetical protein